MKGLILVGAALACAAAPAAADPLSGFYAGGQIGYNNINPEDGFDFDIDGFQYGVYGGINLKVPLGLVVGAEANFNLGTGDIDNDLGITGHVGVAVAPRTQVFGRFGWQRVDIDIDNVFGGGLSSIDDADSSYLIGLGAQIGLTDSISIRSTLDTVEFDTVRLTGGVAFHF